MDIKEVVVSHRNKKQALGRSMQAGNLHVHWRPPMGASHNPPSLHEHLPLALSFDILLEG
jgi:hypothetical protein